MNLTQRLIRDHLVWGTPEPGEEIALRVDQTLTQDALGMLCYIALEGLGIQSVRTELSVSYLDHNMVYMDYKNPDDHAYLQGIARRYGLVLSRAGNGICHLLHLERFSRPGALLVGNDSHTPSAGAACMLGVGAGGMDVAAAMAGAPLILRMPRVVRVELTGALPPGVSAKDAALWLVGRLGVAGGRGRALEYTGPGLAGLTVPQRMTLANMGAETGATTSVFPADEMLRRFLAANGREEVFRPMAADPDAVYDETICCDLSALRPMVALPHQPDRVCPVAEAGPVAVDQVFIGSCTNSSYTDLRRAALVLEGRRVHPRVSLVVSPGSRTIFRLLLRDGSIERFVAAGARILECACGPCVGMGQAVRSGGVSVRTANRNFKGRCGTADSSVYLVSPETAAACAVLGRLGEASELVDPARLAQVTEPERYPRDDGMFLFPPEDGRDAPILRGPNIRPMPVFAPLPERLEAAVSYKLGDNVSTDEIAPAGPAFVALRANIPEASKSVFVRLDPDFPNRAVGLGQSILVAGENYGQGSSREHAAALPRYLGVRAVLARSIARIHRGNLINFGILPLLFESEADYRRVEQGDLLCLEELPRQLRQGRLRLWNRTGGWELWARLDASPREVEVLLAGGLLNHIANSAAETP